MKKFGALIICLFMILTCSMLGGCAGFKIDEVKYYNSILATVGEKNITRYDLLTAYNNYGYTYYVSQQGQNEQQALSSTLDLLIDREAMYQYALDNEATYKPTSYQVNEVVNKTFESIDSAIKNYIEEAKNILNIEDETVTDETTTETNSLPYSNYVYAKRAKLITDENGELKIVYNLEKDPTEFNKLIEQKYLTDFKSNDTIIAVKDAYLAKLKVDLTKDNKENADAIYSKVISLLVKDLNESEKYLRDSNGNAYSKDTEATLIRYFERVYNGELQSKYLENIKTVYMNNETLSITELVEAYDFLVDASADKYADEDAYKTAMKDAGTDADSILYHPELSDGTEFGYFVHALVKFSDTEKAELEKYKDTNQTKYEQTMGAITVNPRKEDGTIDEETSLTLNQVINEYNSIVSIENYNERLEAFIQFMFKYTEDTATLSAGMPYVVGTNGYVDLKDEFPNSAMEQAFTKECLALMTESKGAMSNVSIQDVESRCITSYGIHFVFYVGNVKDFYLPNVEVTIEKLYNTTLNPLTHETYFDMLFDKVYPASSDSKIYSSNTSYSDHEEIILETSKNAHKVTKYTTRINATKTSL